MSAPAEASIYNEYSDMRISGINKLGTDALKDCVVLELEARDLWHDSEVQWAFNFSMAMHEGEERKDGPYQNHILRAALWAVREFNVANPEVAKATLLHDVVENHPKRIISELGSGKILQGGTDREQALETLRRSERLTQQDTLQAIGCLTCPSFEELTSIGKRQAYARRLIDVTLKQPIATVAKLADRLDNFNGNAYNPDPVLQRRLDLKYYPLSETFSESVCQSNPLIPRERQNFVTDVLKDGQNKAKERLMQTLPTSPGLSEAEVDALTLTNLFQLADTY